MSRTRRVDDKKQMEVQIDELNVRGYALKSTGESSARLKKKDLGDATTHLILAALTVWWTLGLANVIYAVYARTTGEEVVIKIDS